MSSPCGHEPPEVPSSWLAGSARDLLSDPLATYTAAHAHGDVVTMRVGPPKVGWSACILYHPDDIQHVLAGAVGNYPKQDPSYMELRRWFGTGLLTYEGPRWQARRRTIQPLFTAHRVAEFDEPMRIEIDRLLERWVAQEQVRDPIDLHSDITQFTLRVVSRVLLGGDADAMLGTISSTYPVLNRQVLRRLTSLVPLSDRVPLPSNRRAHAAKARLFGAAREVVHGRATSVATPGDGDLLDRLLAARDPETGATLSEEEVVSEVVTFLLAGHETTATALTATLHLLARHPDIQERLHEDVIEVIGGGTPGATDVPQLEAVASVFNEGLRLYPPVWGLPRLAAADDTVSGYRLPEDRMVMLPQWVTQRDPRWWDAPEQFQPDRWGADGQSDRHRYAWFPFGGGPRACVGRHFALQEAVMLLATIVQRFRLRPVTARLDIEAGVTLRPSAPVMAALEARSR